MNQVLVINKREFFPLIGGSFEGLKKFSNEEIDTLKKSFHWTNESEIEKNPDLKKIFFHSSIISPKGKIFIFQKNNLMMKNGRKKKIIGNWSIGLSTHAKKISNQANFLSTVEEVIEKNVETFGGIKKMHIIGGINNSTNAIGRAHFGILMVMETHAEKIEPKGDEIVSGEFRSFTKISTLFASAYNVENLSRLYLPLIPSALT